MDNLKNLGLKKNWIYEVIVTTGDGKKPNAAPMGIWTTNFSDIVLEVYKNTETYKNILTTNELVVNFVDNLEIFYDSIRDKKKIGYAPAKKVNAPVLREATSWLELKVKGVRDLGESVSFTSEIVYSKVKKVKLINRAESLTLESLIKFTKPSFPGSKKTEIQRAYRVIKKVAPRSSYEKTVRKILENL